VDQRNATGHRCHSPARPEVKRPGSQAPACKVADSTSLSILRGWSAACRCVQHRQIAPLLLHFSAAGSLLAVPIAAAARNPVRSSMGGCSMRRIRRFWPGADMQRSTCHRRDCVLGRISLSAGLRGSTPTTPPRTTASKEAGRNAPLRRDRHSLVEARTRAARKRNGASNQRRALNRANGPSR
jgi:hypothetical protein